MIQHSGILLVERIIGKAEPSASFRAKEASLSYRGFDGTFWPGFDVEALGLTGGLADVARVEELLVLIRHDIHCLDLLFVANSDERLPSVLSDRFTFCGYDYGYLKDEYDHYSVILNEVIFGSQEELRLYSERLNDSLLLSDPALALEISRVRSRVQDLGGDLEKVSEPLAIVPVFGVVREEN